MLPHKPTTTMAETDYTEGYESGDSCPDCKKGMVTHRTGQTITEDGPINFEYSQCSRCSWNTFPDD